MTTGYNTQHNQNIQNDFFNIPVPAPMEVKGDLLSCHWTKGEIKECKGCNFKICYG